MKLTVLGKYGPYPKAGGACSSYLIECGEATILLDAGNGSFANLQKHTGLPKLDAIVLTHLHSDHISDLLVMRYAIQIKKYPAIPLYLPATPANMFGIFAEEKAFNTTVIQDGMKAGVKGIPLYFKRMTHSVESYAVKVIYQDKVFVYSGDTNWNDDLASFAKDADLLLVDAQFNSQNLPQNPPHLSSAQAAQIADKAGLKRLLLSHINPDQEEAELLAQAKAVFKNTDISTENKTYTI